MCNASMFDLPTELFCQILAFLNEEDIIELCLVNKYLYCSINESVCTELFAIKFNKTLVDKIDGDICWMDVARWKRKVMMDFAEMREKILKFSTQSNNNQQDKNKCINILVHGNEKFNFIQTLLVSFSNNNNISDTANSNITNNTTSISPCKKTHNSKSEIPYQLCPQSNICMWESKSQYEACDLGCIRYQLYHDAIIFILDATHDIDRQLHSILFYDRSRRDGQLWILAINKMDHFPIVKFLKEYSLYPLLILQEYTSFLKNIRKKARQYFVPKNDQKRVCVMPVFTYNNRGNHHNILKIHRNLLVEYFAVKILTAVLNM
jgi:hypothetical protein